MFDQFTLIHGWLRKQSYEARARTSAFLLAPFVVLVLGVAGSQQSVSLFDLSGPMTISELRTELSASGAGSERKGVAIILEPEPAEIRIALTGATTLWTSLNPDALRANRDRLVFDGDTVQSRTPLMGVSEPVALIIDGKVGDEIQIPGATVPSQHSQRPARRAASVISGVLLACMFAWGVAFAEGAGPVQQVDRKKST